MSNPPSKEEIFLLFNSVYSENLTSTTHTLAKFAAIVLQIANSTQTLAIVSIATQNNAEAALQLVDTNAQKQFSSETFQCREHNHNVSKKSPNYHTAPSNQYYTQ